MPKIHFAYSVPRGKTLLRRGVDKAIAATGGVIPPLHRFGTDTLIPWQHPIRAPHSISYHLLHAFKERMPTRFYGMYEHTVCPLRPDDFFLGLPAQDSGDPPWHHPDPQCVAVRTLKENPTHPPEKKFIIMPYAHDPAYVDWVRELVGTYCENFLFLSGEIWMRNWEQNSPLRGLGIKRMARLEMGIDSADYPRVKTSFNQKGKRKFLYIGHTSWYKNTQELERIAERMPGFEGAHIGRGQIRGWKHLADFATLTPQYMQRLAEEYDVFVNASSADPQVTTVLEQMCFGMAVACTPESGYNYPSLTALSTHDTDFNIKQLIGLQHADESELLARAVENRRIAETKHTWKQFTDTVMGFAGI